MQCHDQLAQARPTCTWVLLNAGSFQAVGKETLPSPCRKRLPPGRHPRAGTLKPDLTAGAPPWAVNASLTSETTYFICTWVLLNDGSFQAVGKETLPSPCRKRLPPGRHPRAGTLKPDFTAGAPPWAVNASLTSETTYFIIVMSPRCFEGLSQLLRSRERAEFCTGWVHSVIRFISYLAIALPDSTASLKPCHPVVQEPSTQGSYVQGWGSRCLANAKI